MTPDQRFAFDSIVGFVHRAAMAIAELPKEERAAALQNIPQSIALAFGVTDPALINACTEGIATVLRQIEASGSQSGGRA